MSPLQIIKFDPNILDKCCKCTNHQASLYHCLWKCKKFWCSVLKCISRVPCFPVLLSPVFCILSIYPDDCNLSRTERKTVYLCLLQAKRCVAVCWENVDSPSFDQWLNNVTSSLVCLGKLRKWRESEVMKNT